MAKLAIRGGAPVRELADAVARANAWGRSAVIVAVIAAFYDRLRGLAR